MPIFEVRSPDGRVVEVTAPEGATEDQAIPYAMDNWESISAQKPEDRQSVISQVIAPFKRLGGTINEVAGAVVEPLVSMGTGAIAKPVSEIAGLAANSSGWLMGNLHQCLEWQ